MIRAISFIFSTTLAVSLAVVVSMTSSDVPEGLLLDRIQWIVDHSDLRYDGEILPSVHIVPGSSLPPRSGGAVLGTYDYVTGTIRIRGDLDPIQFQGVLTHELVHYLQDVNGVTEQSLDCLAVTEVPAYLIEKDWADAHGVEVDISGIVGEMARAEACRMGY